MDKAQQRLINLEKAREKLKMARDGKAADAIKGEDEMIDQKMDNTAVEEPPISPIYTPKLVPWEPRYRPVDYGELYQNLKRKREYETPPKKQEEEVKVAAEENKNEPSPPEGPRVEETDYWIPPQITAEMGATTIKILGAIVLYFISIAGKTYFQKHGINNGNCYGEPNQKPNREIVNNGGDIINAMDFYK